MEPILQGKDFRAHQMMRQATESMIQTTKELERGLGAGLQGMASAADLQVINLDQVRAGTVD